MQIIPAIDLQGGRCVRLRQGRFDTTEVFSDDPLGLAKHYAEQGAARLHIVDLDAAQGVGANNLAAVARLVADVPSQLQIGGGLRQSAQLDALFARGVRRVVIGSLAITDNKTVCEWIERYGGERIVLALDVRIIDGAPLVMTHGWQRQSELTLWQVLDAYAAVGVAHVLCTDVDRDGMSRGPNLALYEVFRSRYPQIGLQASGGVRAGADLADLEALGVPHVIVGRALLDGSLRLAGAAAC